MASFNILPLAQFEGGQTSIKRPREFTFFSYDDNKRLKPLSTESLRYYYPPFIQAPGTAPIGVSLSKGFDNWIKADDTVDGHLDALLATVQAHEEQLLIDGITKIEDIRTRSDFLTWRGMMTKIMTAGFDIFSDFEMNATCYEGTIYIEEDHAYRMADRRNDKQPPRQGQQPQELMQYWGYKFEVLSVLDRPWSECDRHEIEHREEVIVNNNAQYCSIVRTGMGKNVLVLGGEVDCVMGEKPNKTDGPMPWIELKTTAEPPNDHPREVQKFERKLLRFWAQSFLLGVPKIIVGYRTADGHLTRLHEFETQRIPGLVSRGQGTWNGNICINMTARFLDHLKTVIMGQDGVWRIKRAKNSKHIEIYRLKGTGSGSIISREFKAHRENLLAAELAQNSTGETTVADQSNDD